MARNYKEIFESGKFYHLYNRSVGNEPLFYNHQNYLYFLAKFDMYLSCFFEYYAYCLLPNHFHFIIQIKEKPNNFDCDESQTDINKLISESFRKFSITYSQAINKQENRLGSLFMRPFKRIGILNEDYLKHLILYIHLNPVHHKVTDNFETYYWSSYRILSDSRPSKINRNKVINLFEDMENLVYVHKQKKEFEIIKNLVLEENN